MAHVGNGATVRGMAPRYTDAMQRPANPRAGDRLAIHIPPGGHARVEKAQDGSVSVVAHDRNYNPVDGGIAPSADCVTMK
jgi:hypothetical protein